LSIAQRIGAAVHNSSSGYSAHRAIILIIYRLRIASSGFVRDRRAIIGRLLERIDSIALLIDFAEPNLDRIQQIQIPEQ
jgi:hypothetical protein